MQLLGQRIPEGNMQLVRTVKPKYCEWNFIFPVFFGL